MTVIFLLIPLSVVIATGFLGAFIWAVRSGQYEDTYTPSMRVLHDQVDELRPVVIKKQAVPAKHRIQQTAQTTVAVTRPSNLTPHLSSPTNSQP